MAEGRGRGEGLRARDQHFEENTDYWTGDNSNDVKISNYNDRKNEFLSVFFSSNKNLLTVKINKNVVGGKHAAKLYCIWR